jgi:hypothetical protein
VFGRDRSAGDAASCVDDLGQGDTPATADVEYPVFADGRGVERPGESGQQVERAAHVDVEYPTGSKNESRTRVRAARWHTPSKRSSTLTAGSPVSSTEPDASMLPDRLVAGTTRPTLLGRVVPVVWRSFRSSGDRCRTDARR